MDKQEFEDWLEETVSDSLDMDWTPRCAAKLIISRLQDAGRLTTVLEALKGADL